MGANFWKWANIVFLGDFSIDGCMALMKTKFQVSHREDNRCIDLLSTYYILFFLPTISKYVADY